MLSRSIYFSTILACWFLHPAAMAADPYAGSQTYNSFCAVCHKSGLNAAPKYGNKAQWQKVIEKGKEAVYKNAIEGIRGMPPRGGYSQLSDEEVKQATDYMIGAAGGWGDSE